MTERRITRPGVVFLVLALIVIAAAAGGYFLRRATNRLPRAGTPIYEDFTRRFYHALAALEVGLLDDAKRDFTTATRLVAGEPAAWANLGLSEIRLGNFDAAAPPIQKAAALAPQSADVEFLYGQLETSRGRLEEGIRHLRRAAELNPLGLRPRAALAQEIERAGGPNADAEAQQLYEQILTVRPQNMAALLERARLAAKRGDAQALQDCVARLGSFRESWSPVAREQYDALRRATTSRSVPDAARSVAFLRNVLVRVPAFRENLAEIRVASELIADPFQRFLRLMSPASTPSPPDQALEFLPEPLGSPGSERVAAVVAFDANSGVPPVIAADGRSIRGIAGTPLADSFPGGPSQAPPTANGVLAVDWSRDFKVDLVLAGRGGLRLLAQPADSTQGGATPASPEPTFVDRTADVLTGLREVSADCFGVWTADVDMDGDLDLILGLYDGTPRVLRNNGDGTWQSIQPFAGVIGLRAFGWADLDRDGDPDAVLLDSSGTLHFFENRQGGQFQEWTPPPSDVSRNVIAFTVGDVNGDGWLDVVTLDANGVIRRVSRGESDGGTTAVTATGWTASQLVSWPGGTGSAGMPQVGSFRLFLADLDNNGAIDLIASGAGRSQVWLGAGVNEFRPLRTFPDVEVFSVIDLDGDGQLDLVGLSAGQPVSLKGHGSMGYHWQVIRPRAQPTAGDQRINSFGVGGEIEIRSGLLTQKQLLSGQPVHFGLGSRTGIDVARIVWPNGVVQADFDAAADKTVVAEQRLKGSCPWLFAFDGKGLTFVTDFLWRSPLGLKINAQDTAGVTQTEDWVKIRGDQLVPKDNSYDIRITAELWETHFIDRVSLMAVDHPNAVEVFVDERFAKDPPSLAVQTLTPPVAVRRAWDETGRDVTMLVARQDGRYLTTFELGEYQGIAKEHFVEVEVPESMALAPHPWLVANGWIYPTDSSINVAIGQGRAVRPGGLSLEAQDQSGRWVTVAPDIGFPAGKNKTILIDLGLLKRSGLDRTRRLRLRTNLEIYWDWLATAESADDSRVRATRITASAADLRYRGFSQTAPARPVDGDVPIADPPHPANRLGPELPRYDRIANVAPRWRDLVGYYTRFGDVRELVASTDDRYVIMNAGDELRLRFDAPPPPPAGWRRDFVLIADGWEKDGDFNTTASKTVDPLPAHDRPDYAASTVNEIEQDPVYRRHPDDWQTYHTRFVAPTVFLRGLGARVAH